MASVLIINEKPSVSREFAHALGVEEKEKYDGYIEGYSDFFGCVIRITWAIGHLCTLSYPEKYDEKYKNWKLEDLPFLPPEYRYEVIADAKKQFSIVKKLLNSVGASESGSMDGIYYAGDSGREGLYIQMLIRQLAGHSPGADEKVIWIDSQTEEEIKKGIRDAKPVSAYSNLKESGYMRAIEDYSTGINFSRILSIMYGNMLNRAAGTKKYKSVSVGRVMTCVLGMIVEREFEIKNFHPTKFYKIGSTIHAEAADIAAEWKAVEGSSYFNSPLLYSENGFAKESDAKAFINSLEGTVTIKSVVQKTEQKNPPVLFNLAELQAECAKLFKISPDQTLQIAQTLYEKKMTTYPRTDARVLTTAIAKEITKNIRGLQKNEDLERHCSRILSSGLYQGIEHTKYVNDQKVTDHYAIIPTGEYAANLDSLSTLERQVYELIARRFLAIFFPPAEYIKIQLVAEAGTTDGKAECFFTSVKTLDNPGYLTVAGIPDEDEEKLALAQGLSELQEGQEFLCDYGIKTGETTPPKRYTSGSMILAMENAGNLIEDEELRAQIKSCGIGTSATRAETLKKLIKLEYVKLETKTQILMPDNLGYMIYETVSHTLPALLSPKMTASWEKGLDGIVDGTVKPEEYRRQLDEYVKKHSEQMIANNCTKEIAESIRAYAKVKDFEQEKPFEPEKLDGACPLCGADVYTTRYGCRCEHYEKENGQCSFSIGTIAGVTLKKAELQKLITTGRTDLIQGFTSKAKKKFNAFLVLKDDADTGQKKLEFELDTTEKLVAGVVCPRCGKEIRMIPNGYACKGYDKNDSDSCHFFIGKIAGNLLTEDQVKALLNNRKTDVIKNFKSKAGKIFDAALCLDEENNIKFDFGEQSEETSSIECPMCSEKLIKKRYSYECACGFQIPHTIAKKQLTEAQVKQLIAGRTGIIHGFTGKTGKRFDAILLYKDGNIEFNFPRKSYK